MAVVQQARTVLLGVIGIGLFLVLWEVIGVTGIAGLTWPPLTKVLDYMLEPSRRGLFERATKATLNMVLLGYALGALSGLGMGMVAHLSRPLRPGLDRLTSVLHAIPAIALAPLFIVLVSRNLAGAMIATMHVYFVTYVATTSGLAVASAGHRDVFRVLGASGVTLLVRLEIPAAFPAIVSGLKYGIPLAFIGAIIGEWFGSSRGLGLLMVSAMQNFQIPLLWSVVLITSVASFTAFGLVGLLERFVYRRYR